MVTVLDVGLLGAFDFIFPVLITFAIVFALLQKFKLLGDSLGISAIIAVAAAFMVALSRTLIDVINFMIPWFVVVIIFVVLLLMIFFLFGAKEEELFKIVRSNSSITWAIIAVAVLIMVAAFGSVLGQSVLEQGPSGDIDTALGEGEVASSDFEENIYATLFHPKVLGLMILFGIAIFAILLLASG